MTPKAGSETQEETPLSEVAGPPESKKSGKKLKINLPATPHGIEVEVPGVGLIENGSTVELTDEQLATFTVNYGWPEGTTTLELPLKTEGGD